MKLFKLFVSCWLSFLNNFIKYERTETAYLKKLSQHETNKLKILIQSWLEKCSILFPPCKRTLGNRFRGHNVAPRNDPFFPANCSKPGKRSANSPWSHHLPWSSDSQSRKHCYGHAPRASSIIFCSWQKKHAETMALPPVMRFKGSLHGVIFKPIPIKSLRESRQTRLSLQITCSNCCFFCWSLLFSSDIGTRPSHKVWGLASAEKAANGRKWVKWISLRIDTLLQSFTSHRGPYNSYTYRWRKLSSFQFILAADLSVYPMQTSSLNSFETVPPAQGLGLCFSMKSNE